MRTSSRGFPSQKLQNPSSTPADSTPSDPSSAGMAEAALAVPRSPVELLRAFSIEIACVSFLICVFLKYFTGKKQNEVIALAWATKFATRDSIFHKKFSLLGTGNGKDTPPLLKEGQYEFKFYASGRRGGWLCPAPGRSTNDRAGQLRPLGFLFVKHDREASVFDIRSLGSKRRYRGRITILDMQEAYTDYSPNVKKKPQGFTPFGHD